MYSSVASSRSTCESILFYFIWFTNVCCRLCIGVSEVCVRETGLLILLRVLVRASG